MPQIPILQGIYTDAAPNVRARLPRNLVPVTRDSGVSSEYLRPGDGLIQAATTPGVSRGGIVWNGIEYRVCGSRFVSISGAGVVTDLGNVGAGGACTFDYSFTLLAITSGGRLYFWDGATLRQVTDPDLGVALCVLWADGRFLTTDGENIVQLEILDPFQVDPLKYGSSEVDPDPVVRLLKIRNEVYAVNRNTVEVFDNRGGTGFVYQRIESAQVPRGAIGTSACCVFDADTVALLGGGRNEAVSVYLAGNGATAKIATEEIDRVLSGYADLSTAELEYREVNARKLLYVHLPDQTLVYDGTASKATERHTWFTLDSGTTTKATYKARHFLFANNRWTAGDPTASRTAQVVETVGTHYGADVEHDFGTIIMYADGNGAIVHEIEMVTLPGRVSLGADPVVWASYSNDGQSYSQERPAKVGKQGQTQKRLAWRTCGQIRNFRVQRFRWRSDAHFCALRLNVQVEPLMTRPGV